MIFAKSTSENGSDPITVRITDVQADEFSMRLQEPGTGYGGGAHGNEDVSWLVVEAGTWELSDGTRFEAGLLNSSLLSSAGFESITFSDSLLFEDTPAVLSQVQSSNGTDWVVTRHEW